MEESRGKSEVVEMRRRIDLENEAGRLALYGYAEVARHDRIIASMERGAERILQLARQGRHEEALRDLERFRHRLIATMG